MVGTNYVWAAAQVAREIQIHASLDHPHIIGLFGAFEDIKHVYLVQEFAPGASGIHDVILTWLKL